MNDHFLKTMAGSLIAVMLFILCAATFEHFRHQSNLKQQQEIEESKRRTEQQIRVCGYLKCVPPTKCVTTKGWAECK